MPTPIEASAPVQLADVDLRPRGRVHPSPVTWRDQTLYFLLPDRFSDGNEANRPLFDRAEPERFRARDRAAWQRAGRGFQGGTLRGITSKLDYLRQLGTTTLWIGPIWRQRPDLQTYHGYGIQDFLEVDPRFGTRQDLRDLVDAAHDRDMYVLLDVIYNHSGNNWFYATSNGPAEELPYRPEPPYPFGGWRSATGQPTPTIGSHDDGVWPQEFQRPDWYTRAGRIGRWDPEPGEDRLGPDREFRRGDFFSLKDLDVARGDVLSGLVTVYQYWIALADVDGFRIDAVKHVPWAASRNFCGAMREYAESIGKENFLLVGEVTGGAGMARDYLDVLGRNLDAVLDVGEPARLLADMVKGTLPAARFFDLYSGHDLLGSHRETSRYHISVLDDHDMVGRDKRRFAAGSSPVARYEQVAHALGAMLTTLGTPCVYYGTEQAFDGGVEYHDPGVDEGFEDRYFRESMFGGSFGAFRTEGCHFFDPDHPTYLRVSAIARVRNASDQVGLALRRGRMYPREISQGGETPRPPEPGELTPWSRIQYRQEVLVALNTNGAAPQRAEVTVDASLHPPGSTMAFHYRGDWDDARLRSGLAPGEETLTVQGADGRAFVGLELPPAGMAILA